MLLALLGVETIFTNPLGWFLFLVGLAYLVGVVIVYWIRKERFWESTINGTTLLEEHGSLSYWLVTVSILVVFYLPPVAYLYFTAVLPRTTCMSTSGMALVILGTVLFVWARYTLRTNYSGHLIVKSGQTLVQSGPYCFIRHPAYAGYLLMAMGISLGYSSLAGLISVLVLLLPSLIFRIAVEEKLLVEHFGDAYRLYMRKIKRLIPGIW